MNIAIIGHRSYVCSPEEADKIKELMYGLKEKFGSFTVISVDCDKGVGKIVKDICVKSKNGEAYDFRLIELTAKIHAQLSASEYVQIFLARNSWVFALAELVYIFISEDMTMNSVLRDLLDRACENGIPTQTMHRDSDILEILRKVDYFDGKSNQT